MTYVIILHILAALSGIGLSLGSFLRPSKLLIRFSYSAVAATLISGVFLVISGQGKLTASCLSGLLYISCTGIGLTAAAYRLAEQTQDPDL